MKPWQRFFFGATIFLIVLIGVGFVTQHVVTIGTGIFSCILAALAVTTAYMLTATK